MTTVLLLIHVMVAVALVGVVLLQRSEGGALGIGGGGGGGGFMTGRSAGSALTKTTAVLAAGFFATSLSLSILASHQRPAPTILPAGQGGGNGLAPLQIPGAPAPASPTAPAEPAAPQAPQSQ
jgi:preprotein translocase subunit SecG